jgi:hypothetical protein
MKPKRNTNPTTYVVNGDKSDYLVTLERLKNTTNGNPRFKATIVDLNSYCYHTVSYTFNGHYCGDFGECEWIVKHHENQD